MVCGQAGPQIPRLARRRLPDTVVDMGHGKRDAQLMTLLEQPAEQSHRVGAPGDRDGNPLARTKETVAQSGR